MFERKRVVIYNAMKDQRRVSGLGGEERGAE
jgi:hypothetical protein